MKAVRSAVAVDFADLVRRLRKEKQLTQEQLAHELDVSFQSINAWECGRHKPSRVMAKLLLEAAAAAGVEAFPSAAGRRRAKS